MTISVKRTMFGLFLCAGVLVLGGCTLRLGDFTVLSTKNVDVSAVRQGDRQSGEDCINMVLFFPLGEVNWKTAMDRALEKGKGDVLVDAVVTSKYWNALVYGQNCVVIEGTVSQTASYRR
jgi:hypothetical protein